MTTPRIVAPSDGWQPPWPLLVEVLGATAASAWALVGGLMTQVHAMLAGVAPHRTTHDVDLLVDVLARRASAASVVADLRSRGFETQEPGWPGSAFHRMRRGSDVIDVLVADHLPRNLGQRVSGRPVMAIEGGAQALDRLVEVEIDEGGSVATLLVPDLLGALVLKAAASAADNRDAGRHLSDAALLAALVTDHAGERTRLHGSDRARLGRLAARLRDPAHPAWLALGDDLARRGQDTLHILTG
jgi:hypothetical protein